MSTRVDTYILWGALLPFESFDAEARERLADSYGDNRYEPLRRSPEGVTALIDGMGSRYVAIGYVLARTADDLGSFEQAVNEIPPAPPGIAEVVKTINALTPEGVTPKLGWYVISHYC